MDINTFEADQMAAKGYLRLSLKLKQQLKFQWNLAAG